MHIIFYSRLRNSVFSAQWFYLSLQRLVHAIKIQSIQDFVPKAKARYSCQFDWEIRIMLLTLKYFWFEQISNSTRGFMLWVHFEALDCLEWWKEILLLRGYAMHANEPQQEPNSWPRQSIQWANAWSDSLKRITVFSSVHFMSSSSTAKFLFVSWHPKVVSWFAQFTQFLLSNVSLHFVSLFP